MEKTTETSGWGFQLSYKSQLVSKEERARKIGVRLISRFLRLCAEADARAIETLPNMTCA